MMKTKLKAVFLVCFCLSSCATISQTSLKNNWYLAKEQFTVVAKEAYDYAAMPDTPQLQRDAIMTFGRRSIMLIWAVDTGTTTIADGLVELTRLITETQAMIALAEPSYEEEPQ